MDYRLRATAHYSSVILTGHLGHLSHLLMPALYVCATQTRQGLWQLQWHHDVMAFRA